MQPAQISLPAQPPGVINAAHSQPARVHSSAVEHGIADPAATGSNPVVPCPFCFFGAMEKKLCGARGGAKKRKKDATPRGFEPLRTKSTHLAGERLNHSAKASVVRHSHTPQTAAATSAKRKRQQQDLNLRGQSPSDFKSDSLTTRTCCHAGRVVHP